MHTYKYMILYVYAYAYAEFTYIRMSHTCADPLGRCNLRGPCNGTWPGGLPDCVTWSLRSTNAAANGGASSTKPGI